MTLFNVVFTATAPLVVGWFDRDLDKRYGERFPLLYRDGAGVQLCAGVGWVGGWWVSWGVRLRELKWRA